MEYWDELNCYDRESSIADDIVEEATKKIVDLIKASSKAQIEEIMNKANNLQKRNTELRQLNKNVNDENLRLKEENNVLKKNLENRTASLNATPYGIDEEVFIVHQHQQVKITCPKCDGQGEIEITGIDGEDYRCSCPRCKGLSYGRNPHQEEKYSLYVAERAKIKEIEIIIHPSKALDFTYYLDLNNRGYNSEYIFPIFKRKEAVDFANQLTNQSKLMAEAELNGEGYLRSNT